MKETEVEGLNNLPKVTLVSSEMRVKIQVVQSKIYPHNHYAIPPCLFHSVLSLNMYF